MRVRSLGQEDPLEKGMVTHSSVLGWRIPWTEEPAELQSLGLERVGHEWRDLAHAYGDCTCTWLSTPSYWKAYRRIFLIPPSYLWFCGVCRYVKRIIKHFCYSFWDKVSEIIISWEQDIRHCWLQTLHKSLQNINLIIGFSSIDILKLSKT